MKRIIIVGLLLAVSGLLLPWSHAQVMQYDAVGQLESVVYATTLCTAQYQYDLAGNLTNQTFSGTQADPDTDADAMADAWELVYFNSLLQPATGDYNQDTIDNLTHYQNRTDPTDPDTDGDSMSNIDEWVADTDVTNPASYFCVTVLSNTSPLTVQFLSSADRIYTLYWCSNLVADDWTNLPDQTDVPGKGGQDYLTDTNSPNSRSYRLSVGYPP